MEDALDEAFVAGCLRQRVDPRSFSDYVYKCARVRRETGLPLGFKAVRRYIRLRAHLGAGTLRSTKSAVCFVLRLAGQPMNPLEAGILEDAIDGLECIKGIPAKVRGAPSAEQIRSLVAATWEERGADDATALVVGHGIASRANELRDICAEDVDLASECVWVNRKGRRLTKIRYGSQTERPITTPEAMVALERLVQIRPSGPLFPNLDAAALSRHVARHAAEQRWNEDLWWSGIHNLRHGAAADEYRKSIRAVREVGSWQGQDAERRYGRLSRIGPKDSARFRAAMKK
jgi:integrase